MTVVSNTTPLNYLVLIGRADILSTLYQLIVIPEAVFNELTSQSTPELVRKWILDKPAWLSVQQIPHVTDSELDEIQIGERQAIVLALQIRSDFILLADRRARRIAQDRGLNVIGTLGLLTVAAEKGLITLRESLDDLKRTNFRVSPGLLESLGDREPVSCDETSRQAGPNHRRWTRHWTRHRLCVRARGRACCRRGAYARAG